ncbi:leucoanthocyanidin reductase-like isoform X1 [Diospyros lotus]|uniref:leucoanthocyanidin reductase-like isoform X1 n=1 Tax=Diospyros lotus TaxID=55363 RepID=UPI002258675C|nr:leucoanthocyanidin reductase-like isoform X1 [Diospyros lotus]
MTVSPSFAAAAKQGRVLIIGATGFIGQFVAEASLEAGRITYVLVRSGPSKAKTIKALQEKGAIPVPQGNINDQEFLEKILKEYEIDVVISAVGGASIRDQLTLVHAIKAVGTIKRFLPSEFGHDVDRANPVEPGLAMYIEKRTVRRVVEESGVPYTYICCNSIASWPYYDNTHPSEVLPPLDHFQIYGDGSVKAYFVAGSDIGKFTIKAADDIRTLNKSLHFRPPCNFLNINELASLWEKKIGRSLPRVTVTEDDLLAAAGENIIPQSIVASFTHDIFIKGCQVNFSIDGPNEVELSSLYPDESFRSVDECFDEFAVKMKDMHQEGAKDDGIAAQNHVVEKMLPITAMCA